MRTLGSFPSAFISQRFACIYLIPVTFKKNQNYCAKQNANCHNLAIFLDTRIRKMELSGAVHESVVVQAKGHEKVRFVNVRC